MRTWHTLAALSLLALPALAQDLGERLARRAGALGPKVEWSLVVVDLASGETLGAHQAERALIPASNMKLLTTVAALELLGPDFVHETRVVLQGAPVEGRVPGHLWVVGGGDPTISRRFDPEPLLSDWAEALWKKGVRRIGGDVVIDDRCFEAVRWHPAWEPEDRDEWYGAEVSGLTLNDGCVDVAVSGGDRAPRVELRPASDYHRLDLQARAGGAKKEHRYSILRAGEDERTLRVTGVVWTKAGAAETSVPVPDPGLWFGFVLERALRERGITVEGRVRHAAPDEQAGGLTVHLRKAPLPRTLEVTNRRSQNLYAECLLKTLGRTQEREGSWTAGARVLERWAREAGIAPEQVKVSDGSGLSRQNRLSARALGQVLRRVLLGKHAALFESSLAAPGEEGTLRSRLTKLPGGVKLRGKTGTMTGIHGLSGVLTRGERKVVFAFLGNGPGAVRAALDDMVELVAAEMAR